MRRFNHNLIAASFAAALLLTTVAFNPAGRSPRKMPRLPDPASVKMAEVNSSSHHAILQLKQQGRYDSLMAAVEKARYRPEPVRQAVPSVNSAAYLAANPENEFCSYFAPEAVHVRSAKSGESGWQWSLRLTGYGYGDSMRSLQPVQPVIEGGRIEYQYGAFTEWYVNEPRGLEQGFTLTERPEARAGGPLIITMSAQSQLRPLLETEARAIRFVDELGRVRLHYAGLKTWDSKGRELQAQMQMNDNRIALLVNEGDATYPVTIDPLIYVEAAKLTASDPTALGSFGRAAGISGDIIVVSKTENAGGLGDLLNGDQEAAQIQVTVLVRGRTTITNTATANSNSFDPNPANNNASITVSVDPGGKKK